jgi:uncharacterized protein YhdP
LVHEVVDDELLICGVEPEPGWKVRQSASRARHGDKQWSAVGLLSVATSTQDSFILLTTV